MTQSVFILGRQPALGLAELESIFGANKTQPIGNMSALVDIEPEKVPFHRLGGTVKLAKLLTILDTNDWQSIEQFLTNTVVPHTNYLPAGKMNLGLSVYGLSVKPARINATALKTKKVIQESGRSVRVVPNKTADLSSAQVLHNDLAGLRGWELIFIKHDNQTYVAQTTQIQDIEAYAARDQVRPKRDAKVGMLPPKLAQIIINLAGIHASSRDNIENKRLSRLLDPFCGTGVILQEALLMGYDVIGTDLEPRMIEYTNANLEWLKKSHRFTGSPKTSVGDATNHKWSEPFDLVATETYLGRPFSSTPLPKVLAEVMRDVDTIHKKFLRNLAAQTKSGFRACIAVPAWKTPNGFIHLPTLASLEELGYTRQSFAHVSNQDLIYHRPDQIVGRELVVLQRT